MALPKNVSIATALGTAALVGGIHAQFTPPQIDNRTTVPGTIDHADVNRTRRQATWLSAAFVGLVYLMTKDEATFIVGGVAVVGFDVLTRYNNEIFPGTGRIETPDVAARAVQEAAGAGADTKVVEMAPYQNVM